MAIVNTTLFGDLVLFPYPPEAPAQETFQWLTDVFTSYDGTEQRRENRINPRQGFDYQIPIPINETQRALNIAYGTLRDAWAIPVWTEAQFVGAISGGATTLNVNASTADFRAGALAFIWQTADKWQVVEVESVDPILEQITLIEGADLFGSAYVMPLRRGKVDGNVSKLTNALNNVFSFTLICLDNDSLTGDAPPSYLGEDIYYESSLFEQDSITDRIVMLEEEADGKVGGIDFRTPWNNPKIGRPYRIVENDLERIRAFKNFIFRRAGKFRAFWYPSFENDFQLISTGTLTTTITVARDEYDELSPERDHIAIEMKNGTWYPRAITNVAVISESNMTLTLSSALNVLAADVLRICYLGLKRLDTDSVRISWNQGVVTSSLPIMEISP